MTLDILTPDANLFKGEAEFVQVPGSDGLLGVLNNHAPLISSLGEGIIKIKSSSAPEQILESRKAEAIDCDYAFKVNGGTVEVLNNKVIILAE